MTGRGRGRRHRRVWGPDVSADVDEELRFHLDRIAAEHRAAGATAEEAERLARERFGDYGRFEAACIEIDRETAMRARRRDRLANLRQDLGFGVRQLGANRLVTLTALLTIALGIGANTAIFSVVNAVLLRPLPYHDVDRLVETRMSVPEYRELKERQRSFDAMTVWASNLYNIRGETPEEVRGAIVEPDFFTMLMEPALGRGIGADETHEAVAVIGEGLWRRRYGGTPDVLGRTVTLADKSYTIIGVMPRSFQYPNARFEVWVPFEHAMSGTSLQLDNRSLRIFRVVGRLGPGATEAGAAAELRSLSEEWQEAYPETNDGVVFEARPVKEQLIGDIRPRLTLLLGAVGLVLLIACVNVANLMLGTTARRGREMAVRRALGASRGRLVRQLLTESLVLACVGGAGGVGLAALALRVLPRVAVDVPRLSEVSLDGTVLLFAIAATVMTALLFGIAPAVQGSRADLRDALQEGGRGGIGLKRGGRLRATLVALEVAVSVVVVVGAGLLVHSLALLLDEDIGLRAEDLVSANVGLFYFDDGAERSTRLDRVLERVAALDGVTAVAASSGLPPQTAQRGTGFSVMGREPDDTERQGAYWIGITPGYFGTIGGRVVRGREFDDRDRAGGAPVALISESFARALFGDGNPLGRQIRLTNAEAGDGLRTIVGVVGDVRYEGVEREAAASIYTPFAQTPFLWAYLMVRTPVPATRLARPLRAAVGGVDSRMTPSRVEQHTHVVSELLAQRHFFTVLLGAFASLALLLGAIGIYGVTATAVAQRRREIGVRIALGAQPSNVVRQVVQRAMLLAAGGLGAGVLAALWLTRLLDALLYEVQPRDPAAFLAGAVLVIGVALMASALPAWRAARVDPLVTLREP